MTPEDSGQRSGELSIDPPGTVVMIPARLGSTRFPRKVLADATGSAMIVHVINRALAASCADRVVVATDDDEIVALVNKAGHAAVLTSRDHANGTSRLAEAARVLDLPESTVVINVQGDEPEIEPAIIDAVADELRASGADMATAAARFSPDEDPADPNIVKVVIAGPTATEQRPPESGDSGLAMYFSRSCIPYARDPDMQACPLKHIGIYAYTAGFLARYAELPKTRLEQTEQLEQLRALEHGHRIGVRVVQAAHHGIDTPEQYAAFVERWRRRQD